MSNWSDLPKDLVFLISKRLTYINDFIYFSAVCRPWQSVAAKEKHNLPPQLPWLMLPQSCDSRGFFDLADQKTRQLLLPDGLGKKCFSTQGWLLTVGRDLKINLLNPFTRFQISLPSLIREGYLKINTTPENHSIDHVHIQPFYVQKVALSASPSTSSPKDCIVMVIHYIFGVLAFCRPGDEKWIFVNSPSIGYSDIVYYKDRFYAVHIEGSIFALELGDATVIQVASPPDGLLMEDKKYLIVESSGDMMLVVRNRDRVEGRYLTVKFTVFRLNRDGDDQNGWVRMEKLGNKALFVGDNSSVCLPIGDDCDHGFTGNCIYFTNDIYEGDKRVDSEGCYDMGVYNLEDKIVHNHYCTANGCTARFPSLWFMPNIQ